MSYHQITREERYTISALRKQGYRTSRIAAVLGRHRSSIYREIKRNQCSDRGYRPFKADSRTRGRRSRSRRNQQFGAQDFAMVESLLRLDWSPEQVSGYLNIDGSVRVRASDRQGRENISRYLIRAPFLVDKIQYSCREGSVIYKTKMVKGPNRNFQVYDPLDFLAAVTAHIPERREHLV